MPTDRVLDGYDLSPALLRGEPVEREAYFYYRGYRLMAARLGPWKAHFQTQAGYGQPKAEVHEPPLLFHLEHDPSERHPVKNRAAVLRRIDEAVKEHQRDMHFARSQLED